MHETYDSESRAPVTREKFIQKSTMQSAGVAMRIFAQLKNCFGSGCFRLAGNFENTAQQLRRQRECYFREFTAAEDQRNQKFVKLSGSS